MEISTLPCWNQQQIMEREIIIKRLFHAVSVGLLAVNQSWHFERVECPVIIPQSAINPAYDGSDVFLLQNDVKGHAVALRPETTAGSYHEARKRLQRGHKLPLCIWQAGKSFRVEANDGARAGTLRFNEFYQLEFQCIYSKTTKANYRGMILDNIKTRVGELCYSPARIIPSDRLPDYSLETLDIEVMFKGKWKEMASISLRKDFSDDCTVFELAFGLDRMIIAKEHNLEIFNGKSDESL